MYLSKHDELIQSHFLNLVLDSINNNIVNENFHIILLLLQNESKKSSKKKTSSKSDNFGGFQKGFLFASKSSISSSKQKAVKSCKTENGENNIPMIRPKHPNDSKKKHEIPEVQEAMKSSIPLLDIQGL